MNTVAGDLQLGRPRWGEQYGSEESTLVQGLPASPRLQRLLVDLEDLIMREGFLHLSTDDLARRLRCSKASLYRLAPSREEAFELLVERWLARVRDNDWAVLDAATSWPRRLVDYLHVVNTWAENVSPRFLDDLQGFPRGYRIYLDHQSRRLAILEAIVAGSVQAGYFHRVNPRLAAELIMTSVRRGFEADFLASVGMNLSDVIDEWYRILAFGLVNSDGGPDDPPPANALSG